MSRATHCDSEGCTTWIRSNTELPKRAGFITVQHGNHTLDRLDFCFWDCCLSYGAHITPNQTITQ